MEFRASISHRVRGRMECVLPGSEASGFCFLTKLNCGQCVYDSHVWLRRLQAGQVWLWCLDFPGIGAFYPLALLMRIEAETNSLGISVYWWTLVMYLVCVCVFELRSLPFGSKDFTHWAVSLAPGYPLLKAVMISLWWQCAQTIMKKVKKKKPTTTMRMRE